MEEGYIQIEGMVASLIYQNTENGYAVLRLDTENGLITAVGCLPGVTPGDDLLLKGTWSTHRAYGEQFKAEFFERRVPTDAESIYRYLASGAIKNVGPAKARDIVGMFGDKTLEVMENEPEKLSSVRGITTKRARELGDSYRRQTGLRRLMEFLNQYGIKPAVAIRLFRCYGGESLAAVKENPYISVGEPFGAEFYEADAMAIALGFEGDCPQRIEAAVLFELTHNLDNGHTFLPVEKLAAATNQLIDVGRDQISDAIASLCDGGLAVQEVIAGENACYLAAVYEAETFIATRLLAMAGNSLAGANVSQLVSSVEREQGISYAENQRRAVELAAKSTVMVLTGGPGTGKTTSVRGILALFDKLGLRTLLCAPTGRAAKRLTEVTGREASTIHRLLGAGVEGDRIVFEHDESNPLEAEAVVVDEMSMVDISLMRSLLAAMPESCRLVMVGDADQLPSVGPGNVFSDIIRSGTVETVRLGEVFRQADASRIVKNAHLINRGIVPDLKENCGDFFFLHRSTPEKTAATIIDLCSNRLPQNMGINPAQIQVLSPTRRNKTGTENLNICLQAALNPPAEGKKEKIYGDFIFREGDKVMQIRNNYDIMWRNDVSCGTGVFNGDVGRITEIDLVHETATVDFEDKLVTYLFEQLSELEPAYAVTVHKSQGSEYRAVVLAVSEGAPQLMTRSVLYTAVTRARELLIIVGDGGLVEKMTLDDRRQRRYSGLRARLSGV